MNRKGLQAATAAAMMTVGVLSSPSALAAVDAFIKIGDIKGESTDSKHKDWIDVLSWSWGVSQSRSVVDKRRGNTVVCVQDLAITKSFDASSPDLIMGTAFGDSYPTAELVLQRSGDKSGGFLYIKMADVRVTSYHTGGNGQSEDRPTEQVSLNFQRATGTYTPQLPNGGAGAPVDFELDASSSKCK